MHAVALRGDAPASEGPRSFADAQSTRAGDFFQETLLGFLGIAGVVERTVEALPRLRVGAFEALYESDREAREVACGLAQAAPR